MRVEMDLSKIKILINKSKKDDDGGLKSIAEDMGIKYTTLYSILSGKNTNPKIDTIKLICDYYDISLSDFFNEHQTIHHLERLDQDISNIVNKNNPILSITNNGIIESLPDESALFFEKHQGDIEENNYYLYINNENKIAIRKTIIEDGTIMFISKNNILYKPEKTMMKLRNVKL